MQFTANNIINGFIDKALGRPTLPIELDDSSIDDLASLATYRYFTSHPIVRRHAFAVSHGEKTVDVSAVKQSMFGSSSNYAASEFEYLGNCKVDFIMAGEEHIGLFDAWLAGSRGYNTHHELRNDQGSDLALYDPLGDIAAVSSRDQLLADLDVNYDHVDKKVHVISQAQGNVTLSMCFAYHGNLTTTPKRYPWDMVRPDHYNILGNLIAEYVLESIITGRSSVVLDSDATIEVSFLSDKHSQLVELNREDLNMLNIPVLNWG